MSYDFSGRYSSNWKRKAKHARKLVNYHCCLCLRRFRYLEVHHACYAQKNGHRVKNKERTGSHIFPLCKSCHKEAHRRENWQWDKENPELNNKNTPEFKQRLIRGYKSIRKFLKKKAIDTPTCDIPDADASHTA